MPQRLSTNAITHNMNNIEETEVTHENDETNEEEGATMSASDELEAAMREATESLEERQAKAGQEPAGAASADKMTIELLSGELQNIKAEYEESLEKLKEGEDKFVRLQAEFENFRRRTLKEKQDTFKYGHQNLVKDLLSSVDNLDRAVAHGEEGGGGDFESLMQGVELVRRELMGALQKHGVTVIEVENAEFDPAIHEAMAIVESADVPPNTVLQVLQPGFMLLDRMIRPARVVVAKAADEGKQDAGSESKSEAEPEAEQ